MVPVGDGLIPPPLLLTVAGFQIPPSYTTSGKPDGNEGGAVVTSTGKDGRRPDTGLPGGTTPVSSKHSWSQTAARAIPG